MSQNRILGLMKLGKPEDMERLYREGEIYMKDIAYFQQLEGDKQRADESENSFMQKIVTYVKIRDEDGQEVEFSTFGKGLKMAENAKLRGHYPDLKANIYCMYAFTSGLCEKTNSVDPLNYEFGTSFVLIFNVPVFMGRLLKGLRENGFNPIWNLVKYYDAEIDQDSLSHFDKPDTHEHQSELRVFVENEMDAPITLRIGSLKDIAELHQTDTLKKMTFEIQQNTGQFRFGFH